MADFTGKKCDVFGTLTNVVPCNITVVSGDAKEVWDKDLCPRAFERLRKFIGRGMSPPGSNSTQEAAK